MKSFKVYLFAVTILVFQLSVQLIAEEFQGGMKVENGDKFEISATNGNVVISVWTKDEVFVKAKNIDADDVKDFTFRQNGNVVTLKFKGQHSEKFFMEVSIPAYLNLDISTGGGNVTFKNKVNGAVEISTGGGNVMLNDIGNTLSISTGGGNISVGAVSNKVEISTGGGEVNVASAQNSLEISTGGGNIAVGSIGGKAEISTGGGNVSIGNASNGIEISTGGGNINLNGANGNVEVLTGGGNILLKNVNGFVDATTGSGNIELELNPAAGSLSEINTGNGNITIYISAKADAFIHANFLSAKYINSGNNPQVHLKSDFDPITYDVNDKKGEVNATFKLNNGASTIKLNVASGEIFIKKK